LVLLRRTALSPQDDKPFAGPIVSLEIGLAAMEKRCRHFAAWVDRLVRLGKA